MIEAHRARVSDRLIERAVEDHVERAQVVETGERIGLGEELRLVEGVMDVGRQHGRDVGNEQHRRELRGEFDAVAQGQDGLAWSRQR